MSEFKVDDNTIRQSEPSIVALNNGSFVVTWTREGDGIYSRVFDNNNQPVGLSFRMSYYGQYNSQNMASKLNSDNIVVTWLRGNGYPQYNFDIYAAIYNITAMDKTAGDFKVTAFSGTHSNPGVTTLNNSNFVVAWDSDYRDTFYMKDIFARMYYGNGGSVDAQFQVSYASRGNQYNSKIASLDNGGFVVTWSSSNPIDDTGWDVYAGIYDQTGARINLPFKVNSDVSGDQTYSNVAALSDSKFIITWISKGSDIFLRRYDSVGNPLSLPFKVENGTAYSSIFTSPAIAKLSNGGFVITWTGFDLVSSSGIYASIYNSSDKQAIPPFRANDIIEGAQQNSKVALLGHNDDFVISWDSSSTDNTRREIYVRKFNANGSPLDPIILTPTSSPTPSPTSTTSHEVTPTSMVVSSSGVTLSVTPSPTSSSTVTPTFTSTPSSEPFIIQNVLSGGTYNGTSARENFVIDSSRDTKITGGGGDDRFTIFSHPNVTTTITDFDKNHEIIDLSRLGMARMNDFTITAGSAVINLPKNQKIILENLTPSNITANNFIFASTLNKQVSNDQGLSTGAIVGIAVGFTAIAATIGYIVYAKMNHFWPFLASGAITPYDHNSHAADVAGEGAFSHTNPIDHQ